MIPPPLDPQTAGMLEIPQGTGHRLTRHARELSEILLGNTHIDDDSLFGGPPLLSACSTRSVVTAATP